jgi:hypothetical protein
MKTWFTIALLLFLGALASSLDAQVYSPRKLTQRVAPQPTAAQNTPAPTGAPAAAPAAPAPAPDPEKVQAAKEETARNVAEFRKQKADEEAAAATNAPGFTVPLLVECKKVEADPHESLQFINLSLTNAAPKAITRITVRMNYFDDRGREIKEWTTRRDLEQPLMAKTTREISQPAYYMPLTTRRVKIDVAEVLFADGSTWKAPENSLAPSPSAEATTAIFWHTN